MANEKHPRMPVDDWLANSSGLMPFLPESIEQRLLEIALGLTEAMKLVLKEEQKRGNKAQTR